MKSREDIELELDRLIQKEKRPLISPYWWISQFMDEMMRNPELRTQVFKLVDVFPALRTDKDVQRHFREYLIDELSSPPLIFRVGGAMGNVLLGRKILVLAVRLAVGIMARHFMSGPSPRNISKLVKRLHRLGAGYSLDILGEAVVSEEEAESYKQKYLNLITFLAESNYPVDLSLKLSSLYSQFNPLDEEDAARVAKERLKEIVLAVKNCKGRVTIDIEQHYFRDIILRVFADLLQEDELSDFEGLGIAHQAYLKDSEMALTQLCQLARNRNVPITVRLVKGAYWDSEVIDAYQKNWPILVYTERDQTDRSFERNIDVSLSYYPFVRTAVASHNLSSIAYAATRHRQLGLPPDAMEFQVLYGIGGPLIRSILEMGYPVRVYVGVGNIIEGMSFLSRRILENSSQASSAFFASRERRQNNESWTV